MDSDFQAGFDSTRPSEFQGPFHRFSAGLASLTGVVAALLGLVALVVGVAVGAPPLATILLGCLSTMGIIAALSWYRVYRRTAPQRAEHVPHRRRVEEE